MIESLKMVSMVGNILLISCVGYGFAVIFATILIIWFDRKGDLLPCASGKDIICFFLTGQAVISFFLFILYAIFIIMKYSSAKIF